MSSFSPTCAVLLALTMMAAVAVAVQIEVQSEAMDDGLIRETDNGVLWLNIPIEPAAVNAYLNDALSCDVFRGQCWLSLMIFLIEDLEAHVFGSWISLPDSRGLCMKASALASRVGTNHTGYALLSLDFDAASGGWVKALGCSLTQKGVDCHTAAPFDYDYTAGSSSAFVTAADGRSVVTNYTIANTPADWELIEFVVARPFKYEQSGSGGPVTEAPQSGKLNNTRNFNASAVATESLQTDVFDRWQFAGLNATGVQAFWSEWFQFIDQNGTPIQ